MGREDTIIALLIEVGGFVVVGESDVINPFDPTGSGVTWDDESKRVAVIRVEGLVAHL